MSHPLGFAALILWTLLSSTVVSPVSAGDAAKKNEEPQADAAELIEKALADKVAFEFLDTPVQDVADFLRDLTGISIQIDRKSLEDAGIAADTPLTFNASDITLRSALKHLLHQANLTFIVADGVLQITSPERAGGTLSLKTYDVSDLVAADEIEQEKDVTIYSQTLLGAIQVCIAPTTWTDSGGPGSISFYSGQFVVSQTDDVHQALESLLGALRKVKQAQVKQPGGQAVWASQQADANERLRRAMQKKIELELVDTPLEDLVQVIRDLHKLPMRLDKPALENAGIGADTPITLHIKRVTLENALRLALRQHNLRAIVKDELVVITSHEVADIQQHVRVYPVLDLIKLAERDADTADAYDELTTLITTVIQPSTWDINGGPNHLSHHVASGALIVSSTDDAHEEIERVLKMVRQAQAARPEAQAADAERKPVLHTRVYSVAKTGEEMSADSKQPDADRRAEIAKQLAEMLPGVVELESWKASGAVAKACDGQLVVRQTAAVHKQIVKFLQELGITVPQSTGMGGTGVF